MTLQTGMEAAAARKAYKGVSGLLLRSPLLVVVIVVAALLVGVNVYLRTELRSVAIGEARSEMQQLMRSYASQIEQRFVGIETTLNALAVLIAAGDHTSRETHLLLRQAVQTLGVLRVIGVTNDVGQVVHSSRSDPAPDVSLAGRDYVDYFLHGGTAPRFLSAPVVNIVDQQWQVSLSVPIRKRDGSLWGVISAVVDPRLLIGTIESVAAADDFVTLLYDDFRIIARLPWLEDRIDTSLADADVVRDLAASPAGWASGVYTGRISGDQRVAAITRLFNDQLVLSTSRPLHVALGFWRFLELVVAIASVITFTLVVLISWLMRRRFAENTQYASALSTLNDRLREENTKNRHLADVKGRFLANMSHEIRTPMNAVLGLGYLLGTTRLDDVQRRHVEQIMSSGRFLLGLLDDILTFSRAEAGELALEQVDFDLDEILSALGTVMSMNARDKDVEVVIDVDPDVSMKLRGDPLRLQQILLNLTGNAIKFTEKGLVKLRVERLAADAGRQRLQFSVADTGIGIGDDRRQDLFTAFTQADASTTRRFGGSGLGLAISHRLVSQMGGQIEVDSTLGKGSVFTFVIEFEPPEVLAAPVKAAKALNVLVVDDHPVARQALAHLVQSLGWQADVVASGEQALERLRMRADAADAYDVLLIDGQMPGVDGWQTSLEIRSEGLAGDSPIVIMARADDHVQLHGQVDATWDAVLVKPVTASSLYDAVIELQVRRQSLEMPAADVRAALDGARIDGVRILVVEDNEVNQDVARRVLELAGASVAVASNGQLAVDRISSEPEQFDVVLMDVQMPVMDGFTATRLIRDQLGRRDLPILALTAGVLDDDRARCREAGMDDFIPKPIQPDQMVRTIRKHAWARLNPSPDARPAVGRSNSSSVRDRDGVGGRAESHGGGLQSEPISGADFGAAIAGIAMAEAAQRLGGDRALFESLLDMAAEHFVDAVPRIREDLTQARYAEAGRRLHALRGIAGNVSAVEVAALATELEGAIGQGLPKERLDGLRQRLAVAITEVVAAINSRPRHGQMLAPAGLVG